MELSKEKNLESEQEFLQSDHDENAAYNSFMSQYNETITAHDHCLINLNLLQYLQEFIIIFEQH